MAKYINEYIETIKRNTGEPAGYGSEVYEGAIAQSVRVYSRYKPRTIVTDLTGATPAIFDVNLPSTFLDGASSIISVEYPLNTSTAVPNFLKESAFRTYRSPTGLTLRLLENRVSAGETLRLTFSAPHTVGVSASTIPLNHEDAIGNLATSIFAEVVAADYSQIFRSSLDDVAIDFRNKAIEWQILSDRYEILFRKDLGLRDDDTEPAGGWTDLDSGFSFGMDYLTHPKRWR